MNNVDQAVGPIIGFAGHSGSGKSTAAAHLVNNYFMDSYSFAAPIKRALAAMFGFGYEHLEGEFKGVLAPFLGKSPRELMQTLGTEWGRELVGEDVWVSAVDREINADVSAIEAAGLVWYGAVIPDVRFGNESAWVRSRGGTVVHLRRDGADGVPPHVSERGIEVFPGDLVIDNRCSGRELLDRLDGAMGALGIVMPDDECCVADDA